MSIFDLQFHSPFPFSLSPFYQHPPINLPLPFLFSNPPQTQPTPNLKPPPFRLFFILNFQASLFNLTHETTSHNYPLLSDERKDGGGTWSREGLVVFLVNSYHFFHSFRVFNHMEVPQPAKWNLLTLGMETLKQTILIHARTISYYLGTINTSIPSRFPSFLSLSVSSVPVLIPIPIPDRMG